MESPRGSRRTERIKEWECHICTLLNGYQRKTCAACLNDRSENSLELFSQLSQPPPQVSTRRRRLKLSMPAGPMLSQLDMASLSQSQRSQDSNEMDDRKTKNLFQQRSLEEFKMMDENVITRSKVQLKASIADDAQDKTLCKSTLQCDGDVDIGQDDSVISSENHPMETMSLDQANESNASTHESQKQNSTKCPNDPEILSEAIAPFGCFYFQLKPNNPTKYPRLRKKHYKPPVPKVHAPNSSCYPPTSPSLEASKSPQTAADLMGKWITPRDHLVEKPHLDQEIYTESKLSANADQALRKKSESYIESSHQADSPHEHVDEFVEASNISNMRIDDSNVLQSRLGTSPVIVKQENSVEPIMPDEVEPPSFQLLNFMQMAPAASQEEAPEFNLLGIMSENNLNQPPVAHAHSVSESNEDQIPVNHNVVHSRFSENAYTLSNETKDQEESKKSEENYDFGGHEDLDPYDFVRNSDQSRSNSLSDTDCLISTKQTKKQIIDTTGSPSPRRITKQGSSNQSKDLSQSKMRKVGLLDDSDASSEDDDVVIVNRRLRRPKVTEDLPSSPELQSYQGWACQQCTYFNEKDDANECEMCGQSKHHLKNIQDELQTFDDGPWKCNVCTNLNKEDPRRCELCDTPRDKDGSSQIALRDNDDEEGIFNFYDLASNDESEVVDLTKTNVRQYDSDSIEEVSDDEPTSFTSTSHDIPPQLKEFSHFIPVSCLQAKHTANDPGIDYLNMFANRGGKSYADRRKKRLLESKKRRENQESNPSGTVAFASAGKKAKKSKSKLPSFQSAKAAFQSKARKRKAQPANEDGWKSRSANNGPILLSGTTLLPKRKTQSMRVVDDSGEFDNIGFQPSRRRQYAAAPVEFNQGDLAMWEGKGSLHFGR